jgi:glycerol-3-phosphate O-acyltransferase / dihydroxyacetone phosphate acyltransferase
MLNVFYSSVIIENEEFIPGNGNPCIICANHSNSVMDAVVLVTSVPRKVQHTCILLTKKRKLLRSTAKDTIVNGKGITCWLIRQSRPLANES